jgi:amino acid permease
MEQPDGNRQTDETAGGAIGAGFFVSSGGALSTGGPASLVLGFIIVGSMLLVTMQALAELGKHAAPHGQDQSKFT